ncbi:23S rRNA m(1)G-748 methyltransferase [Actinomadura pelletieri DSM 43383]|uniref:23S rRNA m(1)G-748 methyltransferase n=1 Tax=Actinomadura pelletieri DSM 43383 TaxID=1120940 RepID=A0A495QMJ8_9ACTN|nr:methyltransferase domain-containing protein [Actinomadura pelletieri]RKS74208.1 23S rRNA m(1)G-748 methyltransferase [Actinomadura pelletieri DSM 43383]
MHDDGPVLADVVPYLVCPVCGAGLELADRALLCPTGHTFDIARHGYANLLPGNARPGTADTPEMVRARDEFLQAGHFTVPADRLAWNVSRVRPSLVLDAGAGTGHYLSRALDRSPDTIGLALDISKHAARRAAKAHPRVGSVVADLWRPLPLRTGAADTVINVFAPRNAAEFHRVLRDDGLLFTVTPSPRHLATLVEPLGLLSVDKHKTERTDAALAGYFKLDSRQELETEAVLTHEEIVTLVGMGPSAHHVPPERLRERLERLSDPLPTPLSFVLSTYRRLE